MEIVLHVASPFPAGILVSHILIINFWINKNVKQGEPEDPQTIIKPAVDGTLNVLRACAAPGSKVKRVVVTSSGKSNLILL